MEIGFVSLTIGLYLTFIFSKQIYLYLCDNPDSSQKKIALFGLFGWIIVAFGVLDAINSDFFKTMGPVEGLMFIVMMSFGTFFIFGILMYLGSIIKFSSRE
ncbi:hypothetical protein CL645_06310 [bacterium]|nr:hypothetical protein [bacterium]MBD62441.1 hypothetical protein [bacterium]|tara:strand:+ start:1875 stop:2177 length:303 start_codon:yes stop_codon:yes gene_type:complete